jgi:hypothetical protein
MGQRGALMASNRVIIGTTAVGVLELAGPRGEVKGLMVSSTEYSLLSCEPQRIRSRRRHMQLTYQYL